MGRVDGDGVRIDVGIRNDHPATIIGGDDRRSGLDPIDRSLIAVDDDLIADLEGLADEEKQPGQPVLQNVLEGETDGDGADAETGEKIGRIERGNDDRQADERAEENDEPFDEGAQHFAEIVAGMAVRPSIEGPVEQPSDHPEERDDDQADDDIGQKFLEADDPVFDLAEGEGGLEGDRLIQGLRLPAGRFGR